MCTTSNAKHSQCFISFIVLHCDAPTTSDAGKHNSELRTFQLKMISNVRMSVTKIQPDPSLLSLKANLHHWIHQAMPPIATFIGHKVTGQAMPGKDANSGIGPPAPGRQSSPSTPLAALSNVPPCPIFRLCFLLFLGFGFFIPASATLKTHHISVRLHTTGDIFPSGLHCLTF